MQCVSTNLLVHQEGASCRGDPPGRPYSVEVELKIFNPVETHCMRLSTVAIAKTMVLAELALLG